MPATPGENGEASANAPLLPSPEGAEPTSGSGPTSSVKPPPANKGAPANGAPRPLGTGEPPAPATAAPPPPPDNVGTCRAGDLAIRVVRQPGAGAEAMSALVAITNTGGPCSLTGWPTVELTYDGNGVFVPTTNVSEPGPPIGMTLSAGHSAFAGLRWKGCRPTATSCRNGTGLRIAAPGAKPVPAKLLGFGGKHLAMNALEIGPVQPTTTHIVSW